MPTHLSRRLTPSLPALPAPPDPPDSARQCMAASSNSGDRACSSSATEPATVNTVCNLIASSLSQSTQ
eukprot:scaffold32455_cov57-Phaeocystis_antarctica.AAC.2